MPESKSRPLRLVVTLILGSALALPLVWPQAFGIQTVLVIAQIIAFRAALAVALLVGAVVFAALAAWRRTWGVLAGISIVLVLASAAHGGILLTRGYGGDLPNGDLTVVAWNTQGGAASVESIAELVRSTDADIVSLPETDELAAAAVVDLLARDGRAMTAATAYGSAEDPPIPTSVLIADRLGAYRMDDSAGSTPGLPSAVLRPADGVGPTIVAAHPFPPLPGGMGRWRAGLGWVADRCDDPRVIIAGDLNATVDHLAGPGRSDALVKGCRDAATAAGAGAMGTWPSTTPAWLAAPIDHVLVGSAWTVRGARVLTSFDDAGSDHRPIAVVLDGRP